VNYSSSPPSSSSSSFSSSSSSLPSSSASSCIYDPDFYDALLATLLCATAGAAAATTRVLWGHRHRNPEDHRFFVQMDADFETRLLCGPGACFLVQACPPELLHHCSGDVSVYVSTRSERCPRAQSGESESRSAPDTPASTSASLGEPTTT
jgi:hypothetical protein